MMLMLWRLEALGLKSRYKKALPKDCALYARFYKTIKDAKKSGKSEEYDDAARIQEPVHDKLVWFADRAREDLPRP
jgi:hypothetical protein